MKSERIIHIDGGDVHVHDILDLLAPVPDAEFPFLKLLGHFFLLIWVLDCEVLHVFHETLDVS